MIDIQLKTDEQWSALQRILVTAHNIAVTNAAEVRLPREVVVDLRECMDALGDKLEAPVS